MNNQDNFSQIFQESDSNLSVVSFGANITFKISRLLQVANVILSNQALALIGEELKKQGIGSLANIKTDYWNVNGIDAEILEPNAKAWKKGKIRMRVVLEFWPEESDEEQSEIVSSTSPLDDIRQTINK